MSIPGTGLSLVKLLELEYEGLRGEAHGLSFRLFTTTDFSETVADTVSLFLYRVEVDPTRRHDILPASETAPGLRSALAVDLCYLLTVWSPSAERQQEILGDCMAILDDNAVLSPDQLDDTFTWVDNTSVKTSLDPLSHEDLLRLWDSLDAHYRISVPYRVRTVRLRPALRPEARPVSERTHVYTPRIP